MTTRADKLAAIPLHERFLLDEETASIMCGVGRETFRGWVRKGFIAPVRTPGGEARKLYKREDLRAAVARLGKE